ncbi:MAG TPA: enoyl-CoA hydratase-related protein [Pseudomonadales bacterium]|nr:enoyl-CoA hydratase-related protein [Pseudomonadales bacterium]
MLTILSEQRGAVGVITINRPERFNAMDVQTAQDFRRAALRLARDTDVRVVILQGLPGMFCSGADLKFIRNGGSSGDLEYLTRAEYRRPPEGTPIQYGEVFKQILEYIHSAISEIRRAPKPFIAAVDGVAAAGGLGIAMACDIVVASQRASFEWAYSKTALTGAESTTFMLPRLIGLRRSLELLFLNPRLTAAAARYFDAPGVTLHFDLCELHGYHYHTGLVFAAYVGGQGEAVANGGRYDDIGRVFGRARPATGFSFDLKTLLGVLPPETAVMPSRGIFVAHELACDAWDEVCRLRDAGERVLTGLPGQRVSACCDRELRRAGAAWRIDTL